MFLRIRSLVLVVASISLLAGLIGCQEIEVKDGRLPESYRETASQVMGNYLGRAGEPGSLNLSLDGERVLVRYLVRDLVRHRNSQAEGSASDFIHPNCESAIGHLVRMKVVENTGNNRNSSNGIHKGAYTLKWAEFAFEPNFCRPSVEGRRLLLEFSEKGAETRIAASVLLENRQWDDCQMDSGNPTVGVPPQQRCERRSSPIYLTRKFSK